MEVICPKCGKHIEMCNSDVDEVIRFGKTSCSNCLGYIPESIIKRFLDGNIDFYCNKKSYETICETFNKFKIKWCDGDTFSLSWDKFEECDELILASGVNGIYYISNVPDFRLFQKDKFYSVSDGRFLP